MGQFPLTRPGLLYLLSEADHRYRLSLGFCQRIISHLPRKQKGWGTPRAANCPSGMAQDFRTWVCLAYPLATWLFPVGQGKLVKIQFRQDPHPHAPTLPTPVSELHPPSAFCICKTHLELCCVGERMLGVHKV